MSEVTEAAIREALTQVVDPELFVNVVDLGLICGIAIETTDAAVGSEDRNDDDQPRMPRRPQLLSAAQKVVAGLDGVNNVDVKLVMSPPWTPDRMTEEAKDQFGIF